MELLGLKVTHATFGAGIVTEQVDNYITVSFSEKTAKFVYPNAFEKFLKANDTDVQRSITDTIHNAITKKIHPAGEASHKAQTSGTVPKIKKSKTLDELFSPDYHVEKLARQPILTYQQVESQFGIRISGFGRGINPTNNAVVLISSIGKSGGHFVYHDRWTVSGEYLYSGEGKTGNQTMTKGNLAIKDAAYNGKEIHLFVKFSPREYYYQGIFELVDYTYENENDENGNNRKEYKFRLRKLMNKTNNGDS